MSLFKGLKESKERKKARDFFDNAPKLKGDPRELRKLKSLLGARTTAFIDTTFIEGAEEMQKWQEQNPADSYKPSSMSPAYKEIKTLGGMVTVYLPQKYTNIFFDLGLRYQSAKLTKNAVLELADKTSGEITSILTLDNPILPLGFLRGEELDDSEVEELDDSEVEDN